MGKRVVDTMDEYELSEDEGASDLNGRESVPVSRVQFSPLKRQETDEPVANLVLLLDVGMQVSVELGRTSMSIRDVLNLTRGSVIELERLAGEPVDVYVNDTLIAHGEVVVVGEKFGVRVTELVAPSRPLDLAAAG